MILEVLVITLADVLAAEEGGATRLEVNANFPEEGVTPSYGMLEAIRRATRLPLYVMIRPRGGSFVFSPEEVEAMVTDARIARELGADGLVVGALSPDGGIDEEALRRVVAAGRLPATFHRAFEELPDRWAALQRLPALGITGLLTSGGSRAPLENAAILKEMVRRAPGIEVVVGGGVSAANAAEIVRETGVAAVHLGRAARAPETRTDPVSAAKVREVRIALEQVNR